MYRVFWTVRMLCLSRVGKLVSGQHPGIQGRFRPAMNRVSWRLVCLAFVLLLLPLVGCESERGLTGVTDEERVAARAQERWDALVDGSFDGAYQLESPALRAAYSSRAYRGRFGQQMRWTAAEVAEVDLDGDRANVRVMVSYFTLGPDGRPLENERPIFETWVREGGEWWHSSD